MQTVPTEIRQTKRQLTRQNGRQMLTERTVPSEMSVRARGGSHVRSDSCGACVGCFPLGIVSFTPCPGNDVKRNNKIAATCAEPEQSTFPLNMLIKLRAFGFFYLFVSFFDFFLFLLWEAGDGKVR